MQITLVAPGAGAKPRADADTATTPGTDAPSFLGLLKSLAGEKLTGSGATASKGRRHTAQQSSDTPSGGSLLPAPIVLSDLPPGSILQPTPAVQTQPITVRTTSTSTSDRITSPAHAAAVPLQETSGTRQSMSTIVGRQESGLGTPGSHEEGAPTPPNDTAPPDSARHGSGAASLPVPLQGSGDVLLSAPLQGSGTAPLPAPPHGSGTAPLSAPPHGDQPTARSLPAGATALETFANLTVMPASPATLVNPGSSATQPTQTVASATPPAPATSSPPLMTATTGNVDQRAHQTHVAEPAPGIISLAEHPSTVPVAVTANAAPARPATFTEMTQQLTAQATLLHAGQQTTMRLRLSPPALGDVQVLMRRDAAGNLSAHLVAASHGAAEALGANLHSLRAALDQHSQGQHAEVSLGWQTGTGQGHQQSNQQPTRETLQDAPQAENKTGSAKTTAPLVTRARQAGSTIDYDA